MNKYDFETTALTGSFSTPYFGQPLHDTTFKCQLESRVRIFMPQNRKKKSRIAIEIDYDIRSIESITVSFHFVEKYNAFGFSTSDKYFSDYSKTESLSKSMNYIQRTYYSYFFQSMTIKFIRDMTEGKGGCHKKRLIVNRNRLSFFFATLSLVIPNFF